jgi:ankyrin repeat protein
MWAAAEGHADVVRMLIRAGADFRTALSDSGFTPLFFAAREGRTEVVRALLESGADVNDGMQAQRPPRKAPTKGTSALMLRSKTGISTSRWN